MGPENALITEIRKTLAEIVGVKIFLVGGSVRDILLDQPFSDYDFLLEGELFSFANLLGERLRCRVTFNRKLLTASLDTEWGRVDLSRARQETYQHPGDLPKVCPASWQEDLQRRDFTINTLVLPLTTEGWGEVLDPLEGKKDLRAGLLRILHPNSFRDDPTRILRAIRLKNRLGFTWEGETLACLVRDWPYLNLVSPSRRLKEWQLICQEKDLTSILQELYELGGWGTYMGGLSYHSDSLGNIPEILQEANHLTIRAWFISLLILLNPESGNLELLANSWGLSLQDQRNLAETFTVLEKLQQGVYTKRRMIYREIRKLPLESVFYLYLQEFRKTMTWDCFWRELQATHMPLRGQDLLKMGLQPGVKLGMLLEQLENAYWQEEFATREEGLKLVRNIMQEENKCLIFEK